MDAVLRRSALHHRLVAATAGQAEAQALRTGVVLADASAQHLLLAQAHDLGSWLPSLPSVGEVALVANSGWPVRCCRLTADSALFMAATPPALPPAPGACGHVTDLTCGRTIVAVAGPRSLDLLRAATQVDLRDRALPDRRCVQTSVAQVPATIVRYDRSGVHAYEILVARDLGEYLWDALLAAGGPLGARPAGAAIIERGD